MITRSKFYVSNSELLTYKVGDKETMSISLNTVYSPQDGTENNSFWNSSPSGSIRLQIPLEDSHQFPVGSYHYVDMEPDALCMTDLQIDEIHTFIQSLWQQSPPDKDGKHWSAHFKVERGSNIIEIYVSNPVVWPYFANRVGQPVHVTFTRTNKDGGQYEG